MTKAVLDASVAVAWLWPPQATEASDAFRRGASAFELQAPFVFDWEVRNLFLRFFGRGLNGPRLYARAMDALEEFEIMLAHPTGAATPELLAMTEGLSLFDAAYLDLALEQDVALVSKDRQLLAAATRRGLQVHDLT